MEEMYTQLERKLQSIKDMIDDAYDTTKNKYTQEDATRAMANYFMNYQTNHFTRDNNARANMEGFLYRPNEFVQILLDYAISSFLLNEMETDITNDELTAYMNDLEGKLDYTGTKSIRVVAISTAINTYWTYTLLSVNKKLKNELILIFITERYIKNRKHELDSSRKSKLIKVEGYKRTVMMSKSKLNNDVRNMNSDDEYEEYIVPHRKK